MCATLLLLLRVINAKSCGPLFYKTQRTSPRARFNHVHVVRDASEPPTQFYRRDSSPSWCESRRLSLRCRGTCQEDRDAPGGGQVLKMIPSRHNVSAIRYVLDHPCIGRRRDMGAPIIVEERPESAELARRGRVNSPLTKSAVI